MLTNSAKKYDLTIAYRIYPGISKTPVFFADDKFKLSRLCLDSFCKSIKNINAKVFAILDSCPLEYEEMFVERLIGNDLEIIRTNKAGNAETFKMQLDLLLTQNYSETVYFAEDDYFYLPPAFERMIDLMKQRPAADFVTPYNHPDYYNLPFHDYRYDVFDANGQNWRNAATTCMTFMTSRNTLNEYYSLLNSYSKKNFDTSLWTALTKLSPLNPLFYFKAALRDSVWLKVLLKTWLFGYRQILFGKKAELLAPLPSLATHMDSCGIAPDIDWHKHFRTYCQ